MMIVMDCLHLANYFETLIYNSELSLPGRTTNWICRIHRCCFYSAEKIGFTSAAQTHYSQHKQDDVMLRIIIVTPSGLIHSSSRSGNKRERAEGAVTESLDHEPVIQPLLQAPLLNTTT